MSAAPSPLKLRIIEIGQLPLYNQDEDENPPAAWTAFRQRLKAADAVLFVTPEYNRSVPAALKNARISHSTECTGLRARIVNAPDAITHTATAKNGDFDVMQPPKKTVTSVLKKAGTVENYCRYHPNMKGVLKIEP